MNVKSLFILCIITLNLEFETLNCFSQNSRLWATYYGGSGNDNVANIATDTAGNIFLSGVTTSSVSFIPTGGFQSVYGGGLYDAFLVKFDSSGNLIWATYYGETGNDQGNCVATDIAGNVYLAGLTQSNTNISYLGFQNTIGGSSDAFLVKFDANGNRIWATYYGGTGTEAGNSVIADNDGNVYLAGNTTSTVSIAFGGFQNTYGGNQGGGGGNAFLVKFNAVTGARIWATYYGGQRPENVYYGGVSTDTFGNVYMSGRTQSPSGIASGGFNNSLTTGATSWDAFLVKFDSGGNRLWGTYYGGTAYDDGYSIATDLTGNVYMTGVTGSAGLASGGFQNTWDNSAGMGYPDAYLVKFDANGNRLWATYYGGSGDDDGFKVATDTAGNVYLAGYAWSTTNMASGGFQNIHGGGNTDAFLVKFDATGGRIWGTYYGGPGADYGQSIALYGTCDVSVYLSGHALSTTNIASGGYQNAIGGNADAFIVKFSQTPTTFSATVSVTDPLCYGITGTGTAIGINGRSPYYYSWSTGETTAVTTSISAGTYTVIINDYELCKKTIGITVSDPSPITLSVSASTSQCSQATGSATITAAGGSGSYTYFWSNGTTTFSATGLASATYQFTVTDVNGCTELGNVQINNFPGLNAQIISTASVTCFSLCNGELIAQGTGAGSTPPYFFQWNTGLTQDTLSGLCAGIYTATVSDVNGCSSSTTFEVVQPQLVTTIINATDVLCYGASDGTASLVANGGIAPYTIDWSNGESSPNATSFSAGIHTVIVTDNNGCISSFTLSITQPALLTTSLTSNAGCSIAQPSALVIAAGGTVPYNYQWSNSQNTEGISYLLGGIYSVTVTDANGCSAIATITIVPGSMVTAIVSADTTIAQGDSILLNAAGGATYFWTPFSGLSCINCYNPVASPLATTQYCVIASDINGCSDTACVEIRIDTLCGEIFIPTAFSPNSDDSNDELCLFGITDCIKSITVEIYNRWGEKIFTITDPSVCWDGKYGDKLMETGIFVYRMETTLVNGEAIVKNGNISLIE